VEIKLRSASFSLITLETIESGLTNLTIQRAGESITVSLYPEELGILLTSFGNKISEGRVEEVKRLQEHTLMKEKRKESDGNRVH